MFPWTDKMQSRQNHPKLAHLPILYFFSHSSALPLQFIEVTPGFFAVVVICNERSSDNKSPGSNRTNGILFTTSFSFASTSTVKCPFVTAESFIFDISKTLFAQNNPVVNFS